ncbi:hypothetical protein F5Y03DRAFT_235941 [Xylaria venustula]|nr:hypothetical protein F5Y03DRAFT_235941 [Xylaria venustula]
MSCLFYLSGVLSACTSTRAGYNSVCYYRPMNWSTLEAIDTYSRQSTFSWSGVIFLVPESCSVAIGQDDVGPQPSFRVPLSSVPSICLFFTSSACLVSSRGCAGTALQCYLPIHPSSSCVAALEPYAALVPVPRLWLLFGFLLLVIAKVDESQVVKTLTTRSFLTLCFQRKVLIANRRLISLDFTSHIFQGQLAVAGSRLVCEDPLLLDFCDTTYFRIPVFRTILSNCYSAKISRVQTLLSRLFAHHQTLFRRSSA